MLGGLVSHSLFNWKEVLFGWCLESFEMRVKSAMGEGNEIFYTGCLISCKFWPRWKFVGRRH